MFDALRLSVEVLTEVLVELTADVAGRTEFVWTELVRMELVRTELV